jgi:hypothetical protein
MSTTNCAVPASKIAACDRPLNGRTVPAGACEPGGDSAGRAGAIVGGDVSIGFDEHPAATTSAHSTLANNG